MVTINVTIDSRYVLLYIFIVTLIATIFKEDFIMNRIVEELKKTGVFYLATIDGDQARVRPISAVEDIDGEVCICTNNTKDMFKQMIASPKVEICGMGKDGTWVRVNGKASLIDSDDARKAMLDLEPSLGNMYHLGDGIFEVLKIENAKCTKYSFTAAPEVIEA